MKHQTYRPDAAAIHAERLLKALDTTLRVPPSLFADAQRRAIDAVDALIESVAAEDPGRLPNGVLPWAALNGVYERLTALSPHATEARDVIDGVRADVAELHEGLVSAAVNVFTTVFPGQAYRIE